MTSNYSILSTLRDNFLPSFINLYCCLCVATHMSRPGYYLFLRGTPQCPSRWLNKTNFLYMFWNNVSTLNFYLLPGMYQPYYHDSKQQIRKSVRTCFPLQNAEVFQLILMVYILQPKTQKRLRLLEYIFDLQVWRSTTGLLIRQNNEVLIFHT